MTDDRQERVRRAAAAIANARAMRRGAPPISNVLVLLERVAGGKLLREVLEDAEAALAAADGTAPEPPDRLGASGKFPYGQIDYTDEGQITIAVAYDRIDGLVRLTFGKPVAWLGLSPQEAIAIGESIVRHAKTKGRDG